MKIQGSRSHPPEAYSKDWGTGPDSVLERMQRQFKFVVPRTHFLEGEKIKSSSQDSMTSETTTKSFLGFVYFISFNLYNIPYYR